MSIIPSPDEINRPDSTDGVDLFHITRSRDVESIFRDGLRSGATSPSTKIVEDEFEEHDPMRRESPSEIAERQFDEVLADAKRSRDLDGVSQFPEHQPAVFFWPTESDAYRGAKSTSWGKSIVAVDRENLPCRCAIAPIEKIDMIFEGYYDAARNRGVVEPEEQYELAKEWWQEVEWYDGQARRNHEVWCGCDIPPHAIEWIYDVRRGKRLYEPPGEAQSRLVDYEP